MDRVSHSLRDSFRIISALVGFGSSLCIHGSGSVMLHSTAPDPGTPDSLLQGPWGGSAGEEPPRRARPEVSLTREPGQMCVGQQGSGCVFKGSPVT